MSAPFQLGTQASPPISVTTNGPVPTATLRSTRFVAGSTIATSFSATTGTQTLPADDGRVAEGRARDVDRRDDAVRLRVDAGERAGRRSRSRRRRPRRPSTRRSRPGCGRRSCSCAGRCGRRRPRAGDPDRAERARRRRRRRCRSAIRFTTRFVARVDALDVAVDRAGRPGGAEAEGRVVGLRADRDRRDALAGRGRDAADGRVVGVLDPERAGAVAEPAGAGADRVRPTTVFVARVDPQQRRRREEAHPDRAAARGRRARLRAGRDGDLRDDASAPLPAAVAAARRATAAATSERSGA